MSQIDNTKEILIIKENLDQILDLIEKKEIAIPEVEIDPENSLILETRDFSKALYIALNIWEGKYLKRFDFEKRGFINKNKFKRCINGYKKNLCIPNFVKFLNDPSEEKLIELYIDEINDSYKDNTNIGDIILNLVNRSFKKYKETYIQDTVNNFLQKNSKKIIKLKGNSINNREYQIYLQEVKFKYGSELYKLIENKIEEM